MRLFKRIVFALAAIGVQLLTIPSLAYIPEQQRTFDFGFRNHCRDFRTAYDFSNIPIFKSLHEMSQRDVAAIIPAGSLSDTNDGASIANKILQHSLTSFFQSETIQNTGVARTATSVQHAMDTNVSMGGVDGEIQHSFKLQMNALSSKATLKYAGFADAQLSYQVSHSHELKFAMFKPLNKKTKLEFDTISNRDEAVEKVSLNLSF